MFENILKFFKRLGKTEKNETNSKDTAKERLHLVLMQDRANVSADFLELMKQEIIEVIKKYIEVEESAIDVRLTNEVREDGTTGAPSLYANIPIVNIKNEAKKEVEEQKKVEAEKTAEKEEKTEKADDKEEKDNKPIEESKEESEEEKKKETDDKKTETSEKQTGNEEKEESEKEQEEKNDEGKTE